MRFASFIARHWPFANGAGRFIDRMASGVDLGHGERTAITSDGVEMTVLAHDHIGRHILLSGQFDRTICTALMSAARPGDVLLDVGANIGYVTGCFLAKVPGSRAIVVEPQPGVVDLLRRNLAVFGERVSVKPVALSDQQGELRFTLNDANRGASRIDPAGEILVPVVPAAVLLADVDRCDVVKIDVEGHERAAFSSLAPELARLRPHTIVFETETNDAAPGQPIGDTLRALGYCVQGIDKRLMSTRYPEIRSPHDCRFNDYIARL